MYAVEFETVSKNGIIEIPQAYHEFASKSLRVVLMMDETQKESKVIHLQSLVDEGLVSGIGKHTMSELKNIAKSRLTKGIN
jgi:bisphosphoglycerate-independent phosphoglycerate mutase (AlkP superfamily)